MCQCKRCWWRCQWSINCNTSVHLFKHFFIVTIEDRKWLKLFRIENPSGKKKKKNKPRKSHCSVSGLRVSPLPRCRRRPQLRRSKAPLGGTLSGWCSAGCPVSGLPSTTTPVTPPVQTWHLWPPWSVPWSDPRQTPWNWECWSSASGPTAAWRSPGTNRRTNEDAINSGVTLINTQVAVLKLQHLRWISLKPNNAALGKADCWCCRSCPLADWTTGGTRTLSEPRGLRSAAPAVTKHWTIKTLTMVSLRVSDDDCASLPVGWEFAIWLPSCAPVALWLLNWQAGSSSQTPSWTSLL